MNSLLIVLVFVLLFYICGCTKEMFKQKTPIDVINANNYNRMSASEKEKYDRNKEMEERRRYYNMKRREYGSGDKSYNECVADMGSTWCRQNWGVDNEYL